MRRCLLLFFFLVAVLATAVVLASRATEHYDEPPSCIITVTTHMGFEGRFQDARRILDPLVQTGQEVIVINEWSPDADTHRAFMRQHYPTVRFLQKGVEDAGQARSLNILVRDHLLHSPKKFWVHWEDSWVCTRPFFPDAVRLMNRHPHVCQLQLTGDWHDGNNKDDGLTILRPPPRHEWDKDAYRHEPLDLAGWPLFSLRPSINRLSFFQRHATDFYFLEHPHLWPLRFEWEFGRLFLRNGGVKAVANRAYATRVRGHKSTYADVFTHGGSSAQKTAALG